MNSRNISTKRDRSMRHAFLYINILKTDLGLSFKEITKYLNHDNYRTRAGEKYTESQVIEVWNKRKGKFKMEYTNYQKYKQSPAEIKAKHVILKVSRISDKPKHKILKESPSIVIEEIYRKALTEAAEELNVRLKLDPAIDTATTVRELVNILIEVIELHDFHPNELTDKTLNVLGGLLYHPNFPKTKKSKSH
jgi:hypothetical protein